MRLCAGARVTVEDVCRVALGEGVEVCPESLRALSESRSAYEAEASRGRVYGYSTGLGALASVDVGLWEGREREVLVEHDVALGPEAPAEVVRAAMAVRASQLAQGAAPVRPEVLLRLADAVNRGVTPVVPLYGSVGASGDLAPLARVARCLFYGEGEALAGGRRVPCSEALESAGLRPMDLRPGEALALINSNAFSVAEAALGVCAAERLVAESLKVMRLTLAATGCNPQHFSDDVARAKGLRGVAEVVGALSGACARTPRVQDPYCIRCAPQVYGAAIEALRFAEGLVEAEASAVSENPFVSGGRVVHACNFHAAPAALAADAAKVALAHVANMIERRTAHLLSSATTGLPEFLAVGGTVVGAMLYQYAAASLAAEVRALASPSSVHSIPTSGLQEDVVSMAPNAALSLLRSAALLLRLVALEGALASEALSVARGGRPGDPRAAIGEWTSRVASETGLGFLLGLG